MTSYNFTFPPNPNGDEYIGTESCIDLQNDIVVVDHSDTTKTNIALKSSNKKNEKREFPPPIPVQARTLRRYYTSDGRLILKEENVKHQEYFRAHRANGRLTLELVPLDQHVVFGASQVVVEPSSHEESYNTSTDQNMTNSSLTDVQDKNNVVTDVLLVENDKGVGDEVNGGPSKCLNCNRVRSSPSCIFGVPVHPLRTVHG